jgi:hypothetical protein
MKATSINLSTVLMVFVFIWLVVQCVSLTLISHSNCTVCACRVQCTACRLLFQHSQHPDEMLCPLCKVHNVRTACHYLITYFKELLLLLALFSGWLCHPLLITLKLYLRSFPHLVETNLRQLIGLCKLSHNFFSFYSLFILILNKNTCYTLLLYRSIY